MDKISELLKEAKPLYIERKKRKETLTKSLFIILPVLFCSLATIPFLSNDAPTAYYTSSVSVVEQMGLPTDDYGLLKVD